MLLEPKDIQLKAYIKKLNSHNIAFWKAILKNILNLLPSDLNDLIVGFMWGFSSCRRLV